MCGTTAGIIIIVITFSENRELRTKEVKSFVYVRVNLEDGKNMYLRVLLWWLGFKKYLINL